MASKVANVKIRAGQRVRLESPGGGGWGDPMRRDPQRVARDVRLGYVNAEAAARDYGVVIEDNGEGDGAPRRAEKGRPHERRRGQDCRSGCRRNLHRPVLLRRGRGAISCRESSVQSRRRGHWVSRRPEELRPSQLGSVVHGTTVGTNALLERKEPASALSQRGFRDVLEMRRRDRRQTWGLWGDFVPVVDRDLRLEVAERTLADGTIREQIDPEEVRVVARSLLARGRGARHRVRERLCQSGQRAKGAGCRPGSLAER